MQAVTWKLRGPPRPKPQPLQPPLVPCSYPWALVGAVSLDPGLASRVIHSPPRHQSERPLTR